MAAALAWTLFALAGLVAILGAKALDDRDRRRFGRLRPSRVARDARGQPLSDPGPSGGPESERPPAGGSGVS